MTKAFVYAVFFLALMACLKWAEWRGDKDVFAGVAFIVGTLSFAEFANAYHKRIDRG